MNKNLVNDGSDADRNERLNSKDGATMDPKDGRRFEPLFNQKEPVRKRPKIEQDMGVDMHRKRIEEF